jgi:hypothetical protein
VDTTAALQEIEARMTTRAFGAVHNPEQGPAVRQVLGELLAVLDASSPGGHILLSAAGNTAGSHHGPMTHGPDHRAARCRLPGDPASCCLQDDARAAAALMADDEPISAAAHPRTAFHGHDTCFLDKSL